MDTTGAVDNVGRIFKRGELKTAVLSAIASLGRAHGYAIMSELRERVGGGWKPSPGSIYPALVALEDASLIASDESGGTRVYWLTDAGRASLGDGPPEGAWQALAERASESQTRETLGTRLHRLVDSLPENRRIIDAPQADAIEAVVRHAADEIETILGGTKDDG